MLNQTSAEDMVLERKKELDKAGNTDGEPKNIMCIEVLNFSSIGNTLLHPTLYVHRHFTYFFPNQPLLKALLSQYCPDNIRDKHKKKLLHV